MQQSEIFNLIKAQFPQVTQEEATGAVIVPKEQLLKICFFLKGSSLAFDDLNCVTAIDKKERFELVYIFYSTPEHHELTLKIYLNPGDLKVESLSSIWKSADWLERETFDFFGIIFLNHPDLRRILNPYDWKIHPLRKDFSHPDFIMKPKI